MAQNCTVEIVQKLQLHGRPVSAQDLMLTRVTPGYYPIAHTQEYVKMKAFIWFYSSEWLTFREKRSP